MNPDDELNERDSGPSKTIRVLRAVLVLKANLFRILHLPVQILTIQFFFLTRRINSHWAA